MVKKGPCSHCKINSTPLWRNGPADKPVLCNACGSRYKVKGHLDNYLPKNVHQQKNFRNVSEGGSHSNVEDQRSNHVPPTPNENNSNSTQDLCQISPQGGIISEIGYKISTKKRSPVMYRRMTSIERFQKQLVSLYRSEKKNEESLLVDNMNNFIPSNEIGLGVILLKTDNDSIDPKLMACFSIDTKAQYESSTNAP
ncbi:hypothetical protein VNO78_03526 [Psophocarpus tetragonolobus]|uniref:GATA-type domain-containing protein n=1 Tax=Psophocarpus tetragonolobus TaxID=3891 RepID=A0AAN9XX11_PSOTE